MRVRRNAMHPPARERGVAIITTMLVVALATALAADLVWELHLDIRRTESELLRNQAKQFALGAEILAIEALVADYQADENANEFCDFPGEGWDQETTLPFEGGTVRGKLSDAQGRFNLNNLAPQGVKDEETRRSSTVSSSAWRERARPRPHLLTEYCARPACVWLPAGFY